jgi:hypothetical protein
MGRQIDAMVRRPAVRLAQAGGVRPPLRPRVTRGARKNVWGIDTGASVVGQLTGLLLPEFVTMSVTTPDYYDAASRRWRDRFLIEDLPQLRWQEIESRDLNEMGSEAKDAVRAVLAHLGKAVKRVEREIFVLRARTNWMALPPEEKKRVSRELRVGDGEPTRWRASKGFRRALRETSSAAV